jgi:histone-lysine N-methyltransferase SETMAR
MNFDREDIRKLIYYGWKRGLHTSDINQEINKTLGNGVVSLRTCANWVSTFREGVYDVKDDERTGRPSLELDQKIDEILQENRHATTRLIAEQLHVSHTAVRQNLLKMGKRYLRNVWVPCELTESAKAKRVEICSQLLEMYEKNNFLPRLVTVDEVWIYWENTGTHTHRSWVGAGDDPVTEARQTLTTKKHLATVFWDSKGIILIDILPRGETITAIYYSSLLDKLKDALWRERRRRTTDGSLFLQQDNARPHSAAVTTSKLREIGLKPLPHPPYSPDLAPSDFYLFSPMKSPLKGKIFNNAAEIMQDVQLWINAKPPEFFATGIAKLPDRWRRCIESDGNYFEFLREDDE